MARKQSAAQKAQAQYDGAQQDEARARGSQYPDHIHEDVAAASEAKGRAVEAADELYRLQEETRSGVDEEGRQLVTLVAPNENANVTDSNGVEFVDGKAKVERHLAEAYVQNLEGYDLEGSSKSSSK